MGAPSNGFKQNMGENYMKTSEPLKFNRFNQKNIPQKMMGLIQGGPPLVVHGVITPINGLINGSVGLQPLEVEL